MKARYLIGTVIETLIKVVVLAAVIVFVFRGATQAYDFGYRVFADEPMSIGNGRIITVGIAESASVQDIAEMLEEKGLIEDAQLFIVQELLSSYHDEIIPGIYDLSTAMTAEEMLAVMSTPVEEAVENTTDDADTDSEELADDTVETGEEAPAEEVAAE